MGFALTEVVSTNHQATDASRARIDLHKLRTAFAHYWYAGLEHDDVLSTQRLHSGRALED